MLRSRVSPRRTEGEALEGLEPLVENKRFNQPILQCCTRRNLYTMMFNLLGEHRLHVILASQFTERTLVGPHGLAALLLRAYAVCSRSIFTPKVLRILFNHNLYVFSMSGVFMLVVAPPWDYLHWASLRTVPVQQQAFLVASQTLVRTNGLME